MSGAWGSGEFGAGSWGGGEGTLTLLGAFALRENVIRLAFSQPVYFSSILDPLDASNPEKYVVTAVSGTFGIDGSPARPVNAVRVTLPTEADGLIPAAVLSVVDLTLDRTMTSYPAEYHITMTDIASADLSLVFSTEAQVFAVFRQIIPPQVEVGRPSRDIANPQTLRGAIVAGAAIMDAEQLLGTWRVDDTGDYAFDEGTENLRKRIIRRLISRKNSFAHLPGYGVGIPDLGKQLAVAARLVATQADAETQIRQEPDVAEVKVTTFVDPSGNGLVKFRVFCRPKQGPPLNFEVPFRYSNSAHT